MWAEMSYNRYELDEVMTEYVNQKFYNLDDWFRYINYSEGGFLFES